MLLFYKIKFEIEFALLVAFMESFSRENSRLYFLLYVCVYNDVIVHSSDRKNLLLRQKISKRKTKWYFCPKTDIWAL